MQLLSESRLSGITGADYFMFGLFFWTAECCLVISTLYHLNMSHSQDGEQFWLRMDLLWIIIVTEGTHISGINYIFPCEPHWQRTHWATVSNYHGLSEFRHESAILTWVQDHRFGACHSYYGRYPQVSALANCKNVRIRRARRDIIHSPSARSPTIWAPGHAAILGTEMVAAGVGFLWWLSWLVHGSSAHCSVFHHPARRLSD